MEKKAVRLYSYMTKRTFGSQMASAGERMNFFLGRLLGCFPDRFLVLRRPTLPDCLADDENERVRGEAERYIALLTAAKSEQPGSGKEAAAP